MSSAAAMNSRFEEVVELGRAIRACLQQADLEGAGELAEQRLACLRNLFADPALDRSDEMLAYWVQDVLREDRALMEDMEKLRERMQLELGSLRNSTRSALQYAEVERG